MDWVPIVIENKSDNYVSDRTDVVFIESETMMSWLIGLGAVCEENHIEQRHDQS